MIVPRTEESGIGHHRAMIHKPADEIHKHRLLSQRVAEPRVKALSPGFGEGPRNAARLTWVIVPKRVKRRIAIAIAKACVGLNLFTAASA